MGVSCIYLVLDIIPDAIDAISAPVRVQWYNLPPGKCF